MKIIFHIEYHTLWGEELFITGSTKELGLNEMNQTVAMDYLSNGQWSTCIEFKTEHPIEYSYLIKRKGETIHQEWGKQRTLSLQEGAELHVFDQWQNIPPNKTFFSSAFTDIILGRKEKKDTYRFENPTLTIKCFAPNLRNDLKLAICGSADSLGNWDPSKAIIMNSIDPPQWSVSIELKNLSFPFEYKFILLRSDNLSFVAWESGENRVLHQPELQPNESLILSGLFVENPLPEWKGAGVAIPVFALRSDQGYGIGEFTDLKKLIDWASETNLRFIQILPINDTTMTHTWTDSYPYNAISSFALHPIYANLEQIGLLEDETRMSEYYKQREKLNKLTKIDYEKVESGKWSYLQQIYIEQGASTLESAEFKTFYKQNKEWLLPYAAFCHLRDLNQSASFNWWSEYNQFDQQEIEALSSPDSPAYPQIAFYYFIQYHLHTQLIEVRNYARKKKVVLKGDIPIGISATSVDAWSHKHLFNMNSQTGAPPDSFAINGQNWEFPTYNWSEMALNGFDWWKNRFCKMADYFDAFRIDHILGFFRIWEIPEKEVQGLLGHFSPALPYTPQEMVSFNFWFCSEIHAKPYIRHHFLNDIFGEYTDEVIDLYLEKGEDEIYHLRNEYDTQREVESWFAGQNDEKSHCIKIGLYQLIAEILFVPDPYETGKYHPRISAQTTHAYRGLNEDDRNAFNKLYEEFYYRRHNLFWKQEGVQKLLPLISATNMLVCGEDLGMIPHCVPEIMQELQILSLEVQRMPKETQVEFGNPSNYPYLSVCTTSTHDTSTLRGWWDEDRAITQRFFNNQLQESGCAPDSCEAWICEKIIDQHLESPSILTVLPLQDWLSIDEDLRSKDPMEERINIPAITHHYWRYRMHITLDQLIAASPLNQLIANKVIRSGR